MVVANVLEPRGTASIHFTIIGPSKTKNTSAKGTKKGFLFKIDGRNLEPDLDDIQELIIPAKETLT